MANLSADFQAQLQQYRELVKETTQNAHAALTAKQKVADDLEIVEEQLREKEARVRELQRENEFLSKSLQQKEAKKTKPSKMEMLSLKVANESMMEEIKMLSESLLETGNAGRNERTRNHLVAQLQSLQGESFFFSLRNEKSSLCQQMSCKKKSENYRCSVQVLRRVFPKRLGN